jgi:hypothetical protein
MKRACPRCYDAMAKKGKALPREADQQMRDGLVGRARIAEPQARPALPVSAPPDRPDASWTFPPACLPYPLTDPLQSDMLAMRSDP